MLQDVGVQTGFLVRLLKKGDDDDLGSSVVLSLSDDCGESLVGQKVQDVFGTSFTGQILSECSGNVRQIKAAITKVDKEQCLVISVVRRPPS